MRTNKSSMRAKIFVVLFTGTPSALWQCLGHSTQETAGGWAGEKPAKTVWLSGILNAGGGPQLASCNLTMPRDSLCCLPLPVTLEDALTPLALSLKQQIAWENGWGWRLGSGRGQGQPPRYTGGRFPKTSIAPPWIDLWYLTNLD